MIIKVDNTTLKTYINVYLFIFDLKALILRISSIVSKKEMLNSMTTTEIINCQSNDDK